MRKKKIMIGMTIVFSVFLMVGCGNKEEKNENNHKQTESIEKEETESRASDSHKNVEKKVVYYGIVKEDYVEDSERILVGDFEIKTEAEEAMEGFTEDIILNITNNVYFSETGEAYPLTDLKEGIKLAITFIENPIMTRSIPPQVPGDSVIKIEVLGN